METGSGFHFVLHLYIIAALNNTFLADISQAFKNLL
jgi:hypothetical protein